jgi:transposase
MRKKQGMISPDKEVSVVKSDVWLDARMKRGEGLSISEIARQLDLDRKTVRSLLAKDQPPVYARKAAPQTVLTHCSKLDPFKDFLIERVEGGVTNAVKLLREARQKGYPGSISILRDFVAPLRRARRHEASVRFETLPGEQAQMDWGELSGIDPGGNRHRFYCFAMVLGYSRCLYAELTAHMDLLTMLRCSINALDYFGGVPSMILYDNMKQVILAEDEVTGKRHFNPRFMDFAHYYSFTPRLCQPQRPQTKGKIESGVGYVKGNFWLGERFLGLAPANNDLRVWLDTVANVRIHATTRERPFDRRLQENLQPLPAVPYDASFVTSRHVTKDCFISYDGNRYSVPFECASQIVTVRDAGAGRIQVYHNEQLIARHELSRGKGRMISDPVHTAGLWQQTMNRQPLRHHRTRLIRVGEFLNEVVGPLVAQRPLMAYEQAAEEEVRVVSGGMKHE